MIYANHYREILDHEFRKRTLNRKNYFQKDFAKELGIYATHLSGILKGRQGLSKQSALEICQNLQFDSQMTELFCELVAFNDSTSRSEREQAERRLDNLRNEMDHRVSVDKDRVHRLSEWYESALVVILDLCDFQSDVEWISNYLNISAERVERAIRKLKDLDLIKEIDGKLTRTGKNLKTPNDFLANESIRIIHRQFLEKALEAMKTQPLEKRDSKVTTLTIHPENIPFVKMKLEELRKELSEKFNNDGLEKRELYCLSTHFFNLGHRRDQN